MLGIDRFLENKNRFLGMTFALLSNQASFTSKFIPSEIAIADAFNLAGIISPQHGFFHEAQANMIETEPMKHPLLGIPIHPFYSSEPVLPNFIEDVDVVLVDIQDVGIRVYTYIWSLFKLMELLKGTDKIIFILDRPNPLGGELVEGAPLNPEFKSFVGLASIPMIHGMTIGELALMFNETENFSLEIEVFKANWKRNLTYEMLKLPWRNPSPNLPTIDTVKAYGGNVIFEGTNISEGRGTTKPFLYVGAPFINGYMLAKELEGISGIKFLPIGFSPTFDKYRGELCHGIELCCFEKGFSPFKTGLIIAKKIFSLYKQAEFLPPPYEYEYEKLPFDIITGSDKYRKWIQEGNLSDLHELLDPGEYLSLREEFLLYN